MTSTKVNDPVRYEPHIEDHIIEPISDLFWIKLLRSVSGISLVVECLLYSQTVWNCVLILPSGGFGCHRSAYISSLHEFLAALANLFARKFSCFSRVEPDGEAVACKAIISGFDSHHPFSKLKAQTPMPDSAIGTRTLISRDYHFDL